jgi:hypothetical protein
MTLPEVWRNPRREVSPGVEVELVFMVLRAGRAGWISRFWLRTEHKPIIDSHTSSTVLLIRNVVLRFFSLTRAAVWRCLRPRLSIARVGSPGARRWQIGDTAGYQPALRGVRDRNADFQSAVSPVCNRRKVRRSPTHPKKGQKNARRSTVNGGREKDAQRVRRPWWLPPVCR